MGGFKRQWGSQKRRFSGILDTTTSAPQEMRPTLLYSIIQSPVAFPVTPKYMTLTGYLALNYVFAPVWLADRTRVWRFNCVKTNKDRHILSAVQIFGRESSFWRQFMRIFGRVLQKAVIKDSGIGHALTLIQLYALISRKRYEVRPKLLLMTNRKLHMRFRLAPRSLTTLDDLELL